MGRPFPIVEYAHKINKNTAEFTVNDLVAFMKWWVKQPVRKDILAMSKKYKESQKTKELREGMSSEREACEEYEEDLREEEAQSEAVIELGLTQLDIDALKWALSRIIEDYELKGSVYGEPLLGLKQQLDGLEEA